MKHDDVSYLETEIDALRALSAPKTPGRPVAAAACAPLPDYAPCVGGPPGAACGAPRARPSVFAGALRVLGHRSRVWGWRVACAFGRGAARVGRWRIDGNLVAGWIVLITICASCYTCTRAMTHEAEIIQHRVRQGHLTLGTDVEKIERVR